MFNFLMLYYRHRGAKGDKGAEMKYPETAKRLKESLNDNAMIAQELADRSGVKKSSISQYLNGSHKPSNQSSGAMAQVLNVNPLWLMGFDVTKESDIDRMKRTAEIFNRNLAQSEYGKAIAIPILRRVAAGLPLTSFEEIIDYTYVPECMARKGEFFALQIKGDSMAPGIADGDVVICRQQPDAEDGQIVVALVDGDDGCCKRFKRYEDGAIALMSDNPAYQPMYFNTSEIDTAPVSIRGVVVELRRKF